MSRTGTASAATMSHPTPSPADIWTALVSVTHGVSAAHYPIGCPMPDLRTRIAKVVTDFAPAMRKNEAVWCADAVIAELAAFRLEVSEDEFLDAVIAEDE